MSMDVIVDCGRVRKAPVEESRELTEGQSTPPGLPLNVGHSLQRNLPFNPSQVGKNTRKQPASLPLYATHPLTACLLSPDTSDELNMASRLSPMLLRSTVRSACRAPRPQMQLRSLSATASRASDTLMVVRLRLCGGPHPPRHHLRIDEAPSRGRIGASRPSPSDRKSVG